MPKPRSTNILAAGDQSLVNSISRQLMAKPQVEAQDCPWVQVGDLYVSVTITGQESWQPLLRLLFDQGHREFVIYTGRHGDIPNKVNVESGTSDPDLFDKNHCIEDEARRLALVDDIPELDGHIAMIDCAEHVAGQSDWLRESTAAHLQAGNVVIYAWCYSLFTFCELDEAATPDSYAAAQAKIIGQRIGQLTEEYYDWVPREVAI